MKEFLQGRWLGHPLHALLVHVPTALWPAALVFDLLSQTGLGGEVMVRAAFWSMAAGLAVALLAVPTGLADWLDIKREKPAWRLGLYHLLLNLVVWALWAVNLALRLDLPAGTTQVPALPLALSAAATGLLFVSGYLGGRMVFAHGISVARVSKDEWRRVAEAGGAHVPAEQKG